MQSTNLYGEPKRGDVWDVELNPVIGDEIHSHFSLRPCVVISSDAYRKLDLRIIIPLTGWENKYRNAPDILKIPKDCMNNLDKDSAAMAMQIRCVSTERFKKPRGRTKAEQLEDLLDCLAFAVDMQFEDYDGFEDG